MTPARGIQVCHWRTALIGKIFQDSFESVSACPTLCVSVSEKTRLLCQEFKFRVQGKLKWGAT